MSIIVKGMKMPESCYYCGLTDTSFINCLAFEKPILLENDSEERRPDWCPLVALPDHHGRLVDADEIRGRTESVFNASSHLVIGHTWGEAYAGGFSDAIDIVKDAPTIVEPEEEE